MWLSPWLSLPNTNLDGRPLARFLPKLKAIRLAISSNRTLHRFDKAWRIIGLDIVVWGSGVCVKASETLTAPARSRLGQKKLHCIAYIDENAPESRKSTRIVFLVGEESLSNKAPVV